VFNGVREKEERTETALREVERLKEEGEGQRKARLKVRAHLPSWVWLRLLTKGLLAYVEDVKGKFYQTTSSLTELSL
jgi:hypothetical protein